MAVLLLDSDSNRRKVVVEALERLGPAFEMEAAAPGSEVMRRLSEDGYEVILDCGQPEEDRVAMLRDIQHRGHPTQVIVVTDEGGEEEARRAMQEGASDYIVRTGAYLTTLPLVVERACQRCRLLAGLQSFDPSTGLRAGPSTEFIPSEAEGLRAGLAQDKPFEPSTGLRASLAQDRPLDPSTEFIPSEAEGLRASLAQDKPFGKAQDKPLDRQDEPFDSAQDGTIELPSETQSLRDALARMQRALGEVNALLEKSQIRLDDRAGALEQAVVEARRQAREMSTLNAIADVISRSSILDEVLSEVLGKALEATETERGVVLVLDEKAKKVVVASRRGLSEGFAQAISDVKTKGRTFLWKVLSGNSLLMDGISSGSEGYGLSKEMEGEGIGSLLGVPLSSKGKVRGAIIIAAGEEGFLTSHDVDFLTIVGRQTGLAVENIQLREEIWRTAEEWLGETEEMVEGGEEEGEQGEGRRSELTEGRGPELIEGQGPELIEGQGPELIEGVGDPSTSPSIGPSTSSGQDSGQSSGRRLEHLTKAPEVEDEIQRQNRELWAINAVAEAVSQSFDLDEILSNVVSKLTVVMGIEVGWVYLVEAQERGSDGLPGSPQQLVEGKEEELQLKAHWGVSERFVQGMTRLRMGECLSGQVAMLGEPLLIEELIESEMKTRLVLEQEGLRSFAGVPMKVGDKVIGVMAVASHIPRPFAPHEVRLLTSVSNQVGIAVEKVRLYHQVREYAEQQEKSNEVLQKINTMLMESQAELEDRIVAVKKAETEIQQRNRELSALNAIATTVNQSLDFEEVSVSALDKVLEALDLVYGEIFILDQKAREMNLVVSRGESPQFAFNIESFGPGEGLPGLIAQSQRPLLIEDIASDTRFIRGLAEKGRSYSVVGIPLFARDQLVGAMDFFSSEGRPFTSSMVDLLTTIGHQIGVAVANARLFEEVRQAAEQLRRANDELQELNCLKSDFIAIVSHELRTPLASTMGYVDLMLDEETGPLNEAQSQYLRVIERNTDRLSRLVNDILDISRIEAGRIDLTRVPLDMVEIVKEVVIAMQPQAQAKGIEVDVSVGEGLPLIQGDADRMRQVLVNLLGNAIKFTPQGGRVEVSGWCLAAGEQPPPPEPVLSGACLEPLGFARDEPRGRAEVPELGAAGDWLVVSVTDTGVGIAAEELGWIFDKFYQTGGLAYRNGGGSGLGLSIVRGIVEAHGGKVWVQSSGKDQGSTFAFALPVPVLGKVEGPVLSPSASLGMNSVEGPVLSQVGEVEKVEALTRQGPESIEGQRPESIEGQRPELIEGQRPELIEGPILRGPTPAVGRAMVLVVDDDPDAVNLLRSYLEAEGYSVVGAHDGEMALQLAAEVQPAVILLDLLMPGLDGFAVLEKLQARAATQDIPVVVVSALAEEEKGLSLGAMEYLTKPIDRQRLLRSVNRLTRVKGLEGASPSVLIVDDDKELVDLVRIHLLMGGDFSVSCAYDGREAIEGVRERIPDLIILDILMPGMDGFEVIEALKGNPLTRHVPVLILTAKDLTEREREALQLGTTRYLTKTLFSREDLLAEVRDMVGTLTKE